MENLYKDKVDSIINSNSTIIYIDSLLRDLIEKSNHDSYVLFRTAKFRIDNGLKKYKSLLEELLNYNEYFQYANYGLAKIYCNENNYEKTFECLEKIKYLDGFYANETRKIYAHLLFKKEMYDELIEFYEFNSENNLVNESICYYTSKVFEIRENYKKAIKCMEEAIKIAPDNIAFHDRLRHLYNGRGLRAYELKEINKLIELGSNNKETLLRAKIVCLNVLNRTHELIDAIREAKEYGIKNYKNDSQLFSLLFKYSDYEGAEEISKEITLRNNCNEQIYSDLIRMYNIETLYDKSLDLCGQLEQQNKNSILLLFGKANIYLQKGEFNEAKKIAFKLIKCSPKSTTFARFLALCLFLEKQYDNSKKLMELIDPDTTKLDIYLRHELGIIDYSIFKEKPYLIKLLENYNYDEVKKDIEHRFLGSVKDIRFNDDVNVKRFTDEMNYIIANVKPSYTLDKDVYLIDYGKEVASVHGKQTSHFIVDSLPGGKLVTYRPVIPTHDAVNENKYIRVR